MLAKKRKGRTSKKPPMQELDLLYSKMTAKEVAKHYGVAEITVRKWVNDYRKEIKNDTK